MRRTRSPRERAQEAVDVAARRAERLATKAARARDEATALERDARGAHARLKYLLQDPALAEPAGET